jgi:alkylation response protein AidB-like acyl-CoA dehydrogenase
MNFSYTEDENAFRKNLVNFLKDELEPIAARVEEKDEVPFEFLKKLGEKGYLGVLHEKKFGGTEKGLVHNHIVSEEISYLSAATDVTRGASSVYFGVPLSRWGSDEQKQRCLPSIIAGDAHGSIAITEPGFGSDAAGMQTRAEEKGDAYILNGEKLWITNSSFASFLCVFAITNPDVHPHQGMTAFLVDKDTPGFNVVRNMRPMGMSGTRHSRLHFKDCVVSKANIIGEVNEGWNVLVDELASERTDIASRALGCGRRAFEEAVKRTMNREQFGQKISRFEAVSFKIADMQVDLDAARLLIVKAARMHEKGLSVEKEAAIAKLFAAEAAFRVAHNSMQVHGSFGYSKDCVVEKVFRDSRVYGFGGGTSEIMRFLIQREVYKEFSHATK